MTIQNKIYKCEVCGNIVELLHEGRGILVCCNQNMKIQKENTIDASTEKHIPIINQTKDRVNIKIGSEPHPMEEKHYIEWVEISTDKGTAKKFLHPKEKPETTFPVKNKNIKSRAYCNLHGLWKSE